LKKKKIDVAIWMHARMRHLYVRPTLRQKFKKKKKKKQAHTHNEPKFQKVLFGRVWARQKPSGQANAQTNAPSKDK
jgi:hypothetical protein